MKPDNYPLYTNPIINDGVWAGVPVFNHFLLPGHIASTVLDAVMSRVIPGTSPRKVARALLTPMKHASRIEGIGERGIEEYDPRIRMQGGVFDAKIFNNIYEDAHRMLRDLDNGGLGDMIGLHLRRYLPTTNYDLRARTLGGPEVDPGVRWVTNMGALLYESVPLWPTSHKELMRHIANDRNSWLVRELVPGIVAGYVKKEPGQSEMFWASPQQQEP